MCFRLTWKWCECQINGRPFRLLEAISEYDGADGRRPFTSGGTAFEQKVLKNSDKQLQGVEAWDGVEKGLQTLTFWSGHYADTRKQKPGEGAAKSLAPRVVGTDMSFQEYFDQEFAYGEENRVIRDCGVLMFVFGIRKSVDGHVIAFAGGDKPLFFDCNYGQWSFAGDKAGDIVEAVQNVLDAKYSEIKTGDVYRLL